MTPVGGDDAPAAEGDTVNAAGAGDPDDMLGSIRALGAQLLEAWDRHGQSGPDGLDGSAAVRRETVGGATCSRRLGYEHTAAPGRSARNRLNLDGVVLAGMGGSAIAGDIVANALAEELRLPMQIVRDYQLPGWVGHNSLVIASSFSGGTVETLTAWDGARAAGATTVAISTGGPLLAKARAAGAQVFELRPGGQPRAALGQSLAAVMAVLYQFDLIEDPAPSLRSAAALMQDPEWTHHASDLATVLESRLALVFAPERLAPVARRWKDQLNENAKVTAAFDTLPELNHNTIEGLGGPAWLPGRAHAVLLEAPNLSHGTDLTSRTDLTAEFLGERGITSTRIASSAADPLVAALELVAVGDLTSVELALRLGVDPSPVPALTAFKRRMSQRA